MSLSDLLYPGNPEKRENIIRKSQELIDLMKDNFDATNKLTEIVNEHLHSSFSPITLDEKATIKENCDVMIKLVSQIQAKVEETDEELKKKMDPNLYESLQHTSLQGLNNVSAAVKAAISSVCQLSTIALMMYLKNIMNILTCVTVTCALMAGGLCASILVGLGVDLIASAIVGYIERGQLKAALAEHEEAVKKFRPASKEYQEAIYEVRFLLKYMKKK